MIYIQFQVQNVDFKHKNVVCMIDSQAAMG